MGKAFRNAARGLTAVTGAFVIGIGMSGSASAVTEGGWMFDTTYSSQAKFFSLGEHFRVVDSAADGHSAIGR
ncbi:hypothetical protein [Streptomyces sp. NPDC002530]